MPRISEFYGILITMIFGDHDPPHFHAKYGDQMLVVGLVPIEVMRGQFPAREERLVLDWAARHRQELLANWRRATRLQPVRRIAPLG